MLRCGPTVWLWSRRMEGGTEEVRTRTVCCWGQEPLTLQLAAGRRLDRKRDFLMVWSCCWLGPGGLGGVDVKAFPGRVSTCPEEGPLRAGAACLGDRNVAASSTPCPPRGLRPSSWPLCTRPCTFRPSGPPPGAPPVCGSGGQGGLGTLSLPSGGTTTSTRIPPHPHKSVPTSFGCTCSCPPR